MKKNNTVTVEGSSAKRFMLILLSVFIATTQVRGVQVMFEIEHCHVGDSAHAHELHSKSHIQLSTNASHAIGQDHHVHECGDCSSSDKQSSGTAGSGHGNSNSCHSHHVGMSVGLAYLDSAGALLIRHGLFTGSYKNVDSIKCPDGPLFDVLKPPQLV